MRLLFWLVMAVSALGCGGEAEVGEECDTPGAEDECVEEGVCDKTEDGSVLCLKRCSDQDDCASDEACNGITGNDAIKACHPKDGSKK